MINNKEIGNRIKTERESKGLTLQDIASKIGVARSTIQRYENGTINSIKLPIINSIANALNINPSWIIGKCEYKTEPAKTAEDTELQEYLEELHKRPEMRMLFSLTSKATKADVEKAVAIVEAFLGKKDNDDDFGC